jgi:hypothetical protein
MIHCVNIYNSNDSGRHARARTSWERLPFKRAYFHTQDFTRNSSSVKYIGDSGAGIYGRPVPFFKDVISRGFKDYPKDELLVFTNADAFLAFDTISILESVYRNSNVPVIYSHRGNFHKELRESMDAKQIEKRMFLDDLNGLNSVLGCTGTKHVFKGIDLVAFPCWWWEENTKDNILNQHNVSGFVPDFLIGFQGWDYWIRAITKLYPAIAKDCGFILTAHEAHSPYWKNHLHCVGNKYNWLELWRWQQRFGKDVDTSDWRKDV